MIMCDKKHMRCCFVVCGVVACAAKIDREQKKTQWNSLEQLPMAGNSIEICEIDQRSTMGAITGITMIPIFIHQMTHILGNGKLTFIHTHKLFLITYI